MKCALCGRENPVENRFCAFCGRALVSAPTSVTNKVTGGTKSIPAARSGAITALIVLAVCAVVSLVAWFPLGLPARLINAIIPTFGCTGSTAGTLGMYLCSAAVGLRTVAVPLALMFLVVRFRKVLSKWVEHLTPKIPAANRFILTPALATMVFVLSWGGSHSNLAFQTGLLPQIVFPAIIGLFTFAIASYRTSLERSLAAFFKVRDKFPRWMCLVAAVGAPLVISLLITYQERVSQEALKEQFVVLVALGTSYLALTPRGGGLSLGIRPNRGKTPGAKATGSAVLRSIGVGLGWGLLLSILRSFFSADAVLAHDCSGPGDCLQTAGYNATLGVSGGIMGVGASVIGSSLGGTVTPPSSPDSASTLPEIDIDNAKPILLPGSGEAAKAAEAMFEKLTPEELSRQQAMLDKQAQRNLIVDTLQEREAAYKGFETMGGEMAKNLAPGWMTDNKIGSAAVEFLGESVVGQITDRARLADLVMESTLGKTYTMGGEEVLLRPEDIAAARNNLAWEGIKLGISEGIGDLTKVEKLGSKILPYNLTRGEEIKLITHLSADSIADYGVKGTRWLSDKLFANGDKLFGIGD